MEDRMTSLRCQHAGLIGMRERRIGRLETVVRVDTGFQDVQDGLCLGGSKFQH